MTFLIGVLGLILVSPESFPNLSIQKIFLLAFLISLAIIEFSPFFKKNKNYTKKTKIAEQLNIEYKKHFVDYENSKKEIAFLQKEIKSLLPKIRFFRIEV